MAAPGGAQIQSERFGLLHRMIDSNTVLSLYYRAQNSHQSDGPWPEKLPVVIKNNIASFHRLFQFCEKHFHVHARQIQQQQQTNQKNLMKILKEVKCIFCLFCALWP